MSAYVTDWRATCELCGRIVSWSRRKGDTSDPLDTASYSAEARFWHYECADIDFAERMRTADEQESQRRELEEVQCRLT